MIGNNDLGENLGVSKTESDKIIEYVKANKAKLESCGRHDFSVPVDRRTKAELPEPKLFCDWKCKKCGGIVDGIARLWYQRGLKDADPMQDVPPNQFGIVKASKPT